MRKYRAKPATVDGIRFASQLEAGHYALLKSLERAGQIADLELQPAYPPTCGGKPVLIKSDGYPNGRQARYVADFRFRWVATGKVDVVDSKGVDNPLSRLKRAIVEAEYGIEVEVWR